MKNQTYPLGHFYVHKCHQWALGGSHDSNDENSVCKTSGEEKVQKMAVDVRQKKVGETPRKSRCQTGTKMALKLGLIFRKRNLIKNISQ